MIIRPTYWVFSLLFAFPLLAAAQQSTNAPRLQQQAERLNGKWAQQRKAVEEYAARYSVPIRRVFPDGKVVELVGFENGRPLFYTTGNINAAATTRTDELWAGGSSGLSLDGSGYDKLGIWDGGKVRDSHQEFTNNGPSRVIPSDGASTLSDHATHVAGTMIGGGVMANAKGMAFNATLKSYDWGNDEPEMAAAAAAGLEISNHSYGFIHGWDGGIWYGDPAISTQEDYWFGFYSSYTQEWDQIAYDAPYYLIVKSAGNDRNDTGNGTYPDDGYPDGYDCIGTKAVAKNILTVGAVADVLNYTGPGSVSMSSFSGWGPVDDGRIKPDIVANGVSLYSSGAGSNTSYLTYSGTSMSSPNTSGTLALLQKYYQDTHGGTPMRAATLKALVIHTADEAGANPGPDYSFGWGLLNALAAAERITADANGSNVIDEQALNNGGTFTLDVQASGTEPLVATIVWTDVPHAGLPPALDPPTPHLVNDLDLRITAGGNTYYPYKLDKNNPAAAATNTTENNVDNVEMVYIANPTAGVYTIQVDHDGTLAAPQHFSIVISGAVPAACPPAGTACDDGDPCTDNDVYDADCGCAGTFADSDADGVCDANDQCPGFDDNLDADGDGIPDGCDLCNNGTANFTDNPLTHSGAGSNTTILTLPPNSSDVSFSIGDIGQKINGNPSRQYIELVTVNYVDGSGAPQSYGSYSGASTSAAQIDIAGPVQSVAISLADGLDGDSGPSQMSVSFGPVDYCISTGPCTDSDGDGVCDYEDACPGFDDAIDTDGDGVPDGCDACPGFDDTADADGDGIPDGCDPCTNLNSQFTDNPLTHTGAGSNTAILGFATNQADLLFTISGLGQKTNGPASKRYIDLVTVSYLDALGEPQPFGTFSGADVSSVNVEIPGPVTSVSVQLEDGYDGDSGSTELSVNFSAVTSCDLGEQPLIEQAQIKAAAPPQPAGRVRLYPNPTDGLVCIQFENNVPEGKIRLLNAIGHTLQELNFTDKNNFSVDLGAYEPAGLYFLQIIVSGEPARIHAVVRL